MTSDFWNEDNFKRLKKSLWQLYWNNFVVPACEQSNCSNETSQKSLNKTVGEIVAKKWKDYKKDNNIKSSKPGIRYEAVYHRWSTSVTADEYRAHEVEYYNQKEDVVVIKNPFYGCLNEKNENNYFLDVTADWILEQGILQKDLNEKYIEIPEKFARKILFLNSFTKSDVIKINAF